MRNWTEAGGWKRAPATVRAALGYAQAKLLALGEPLGRVVRIGVGEPWRDCVCVETEMELLPGLSLISRYGSAEELEEHPPIRNRSVEDAAYHAITHVRDLRSVGLPDLADTVHRMRANARRLLAAGRRTRASARLIDIAVLASETWYGPEEPDFELRMESLDEQLRTIVVSSTLYSEGDLDHTLAIERQRYAELHAVRASLAKRGADGVVDQLTLNAITPHVEPSRFIRELDTVRRRSPGGVEVTISKGRVESSGSDPALGLGWSGDTIILRGRSLPDAALAAAIGRPVHLLFEHQIVSRDMMVANADMVLDPFGGPSVRVTVASAPRYFCGRSGRLWTGSPAKRH